MANWTSVVPITIKVVKLVINLIVLILYRTGYGGQFLGVGGTWNLNEEKNPDAEIVASGVMVGYFIYTSVVLISFCLGNLEHKNSIVELLMNFVGTFMWVAVGGTCLHYWAGYMNEHKYQAMASEKQIGLAVGAMCVILGAIYLLDTVLAFFNFDRKSGD